MRVCDRNEPGSHGPRSCSRPVADCFEICGGIVRRCCVLRRHPPKNSPKSAASGRHDRAEHMADKHGPARVGRLVGPDGHRGQLAPGQSLVFAPVSANPSPHIITFSWPRSIDLFFLVVLLRCFRVQKRARTHVSAGSTLIQHWFYRSVGLQRRAVCAAARPQGDPGRADV